MRKKNLIAKTDKENRERERGNTFLILNLGGKKEQKKIGFQKRRKQKGEFIGQNTDLYKQNKASTNA